MTGHAEVIFEDGSHSTLSYENESELRAFLQENHRRAVEGEPSATQDQQPRQDMLGDPALGGRTPDSFTQMHMSRPAFRAKRVLLYDQHPADLVPVGNEGTMPVDASAVKSLVDGMAGEGDKVNMHQLTQALRDEASPVFAQNPGKFESQYKMPETSELDLSFLNESSGGTA